jgi:hypothetical protein
MDREPVFTKTVLYTDHDGRAKFREERMRSSEGRRKRACRPCCPPPATSCARSPVGFRSEFPLHAQPQWVFILKGEMEIALQDGSCAGSPRSSTSSRRTCCRRRELRREAARAPQRAARRRALVTLFLKV